VNTTYYGHVASIVSGATSAFSSPAVSTATQANQPATAGSTWTMVSVTSVSVTWAENGNPLNVTKYVVQLSTTNGFNGANDLTTATYLSTATFTNLVPATTYYAHVKAVNHSEISTNYTFLGSTLTLTANPPTVLTFIGSA